MNRNQSEKQLDRITRAAVLFAHDLLTREEYGATNTAMFGGFIANAIGPIPDAHWRVLLMGSKVPCGEVGCDCEKARIPFFEGLDALRDDWRETMVKRGINPDKPIQP